MYFTRCHFIALRFTDVEYRCACIIQKTFRGLFWGRSVLFPAVVLIKSSISVWKGVCLKSALHWSTLTHATAHAQFFIQLSHYLNNIFANLQIFPAKKVSLGQVIIVHSSPSKQNITEFITSILGPHWKCLYGTKLNCKMYLCVIIIYEYAAHTIMYHYPLYWY